LLKKIFSHFNIIDKLVVLIPLLFLLTLPTSLGDQNHFHDDKVIIDSYYTFNEIFSNSKIPDEIRKVLKLISVEYFSFDDKLHRGQILIHKDLANDVIEIFKVIKEKKFAISKVIPIIKYNWSDENSMKDNNTSAFNYRYVKGTSQLSSHAFGRAIDINPKFNPQIINKNTFPANAKYDVTVMGTILADSFLVKEFKKRGWQWGGFWKKNKDYQHFEKFD
jgi:DNA integrity scanning protein DisA with diadenylate cyclase activity